jgi:hypothetical protein
MGIIDEDQYDPRYRKSGYPGQYEDWLMLHVPPDECTDKNIDQIIIILQDLRHRQALRMKKWETPNCDAPKPLQRPEPKLRMRRIDG